MTNSRQGAGVDATPYLTLVADGAALSRPALRAAGPDLVRSAEKCE